VDKRFKPSLLTTSIIADVVPANMRFVPASAVPAADWDPATRTVSWSLPGIPSTGITMTYELEPLECGVWPTNVEAVAEGQDTRGASYTHTYPVPTVDVRCPSPTPPPTPTYTPSPTPVPTTTPTPGTTATRPPAATATRRPDPAFLPLALREQCVPGQRRMDVALVIDASTSMLQQTAAGRTKLSAAQEAASAFVDELQLGLGDQAAISAFNGEAQVLQELTANRQLLQSALAGIAVASTTRLDLAIDAAHQELTSPRRHRDNTPVMIVLTDGKANPVPASVAVELATAAKADLITIFTIGLGEELDLEALSAIASKPGYFYRAPDGEDLKAIYKAIAVAIPCPAGQYWGGR